MLGGDYVQMKGSQILDRQVFHRDGLKGLDRLDIAAAHITAKDIVPDLFLLHSQHG